MAAKKVKYIFVAGGVMSGVGKGVAVSSIGKILAARGFKLNLMKIDPYLNVDAGTMNPIEHGEVFVLDDGTECDQDMGNYERFLNRDLTGANYMTTGSVYLSVINRERNLEYGGKCVEVVPHIPLEVISRIDKAAAKTKADIVTIEIGGTVGEYQNVLFLEAVRMLKLKKPNDVLLVLVSYLPIQSKDSELKTKPTQYAVRTLNSAGLQPDIIIARAAVALDKKRKEKIALNCNIHENDVISAPDVQSIYEVPVNFEKDKLSKIVLEKLGLKTRGKDLQEWKKLVGKIQSARETVKVGIVGKYFGTGDFILADSYISVIEAIKHASYFLKRKPFITWLDSADFDPKENRRYKTNLKKLEGFDGIIVPGGFGSRAIEGKINAVNFCRTHKIPYFGLCYGMQLAVVEFARNVCGMKGAHTSEIQPQTPHPVIDIMPEQKKNLEAKHYGATMRLGAYPAILKPKTIAHTAYANSRHSEGKARRISRRHSESGRRISSLISERHRHRYELNNEFREILAKKGLVMSGLNPEKDLVEIIELPNHPFFVGTQFHPEFKSRPLKPHPLFLAFVKAAIKN